MTAFNPVSLEGKVAAITGAASGIGLACAKPYWKTAQKWF